MSVIEPAITADPALEAAPAPEPTAPAPEPVVEEDPFAPVAEGEPAQFPREYVEKLRREGAKYRTSANERAAEVERLKTYEETFTGWEPEQVAGWQEFLRSAQEDPQAALGALMQQGFDLDRESASALLDEIFEVGGQDPPAPAPAGEPGDIDPADRPLTLRDLEAREQKQRVEAEQVAAVSQVKEEAKALGYKADADAGSLAEFKYQRLLHLAVNHGNDLTKAHEALVAEEQALVKERMEASAREADTLPTPTGNGGPGAPATGAPDWKQTRERATEFIRATLNQ